MKPRLYILTSLLCCFLTLAAQTDQSRRVIIHLTGDDTPYSFITSQIDSITFAEGVAEATVEVTTSITREHSAVLSFERNGCSKVMYACMPAESAEDWSNNDFMSHLRNYGQVTSETDVTLTGLTEHTDYVMVAAGLDAYNALCTPTRHYFSTTSSADLQLVMAPDYQEIKVGETAALSVYVGGLPYEGDLEVKWEVSTPTSLLPVGDGTFYGTGYGTNIVKATVGESYASAYVKVIDESMPTDYDPLYLHSPYPYLEYPTTKERIMAAEADTKTQEFILRYPASVQGDVLCYQLCNYFSLGPVYVIFSHVFYNLSPETGEPIAWGYMQGLTDESMYPAFTGLIQECGFIWKKNVTLPDGTLAAWHTNEQLNRSCLLYVKPYDTDPSQKHGVAEYRVLSDDPNNTPIEYLDNLPSGLLEWGATPDEIRAYEQEQGSTPSSLMDTPYNNTLAFACTPGTDNEHMFYRVYQFTDDMDQADSFYYQSSCWFTDECGFYTPDGELSTEFRMRLSENGYEDKGADEFYNREKDIRITAYYMEDNFINNDFQMIVGLNYETSTPDPSYIQQEIKSLFQPKK